MLDEPSKRLPPALEAFGADFALRMEEIAFEAGASGRRRQTRVDRHLSARSRYGAAAVLAATAIAAAFVLLISPTTSPITATPAAAAILTRAARAAQDEPTLTLGPGQYLYSEIRTLQSDYWQWGNPAQGVWTVQPQTVQTWVAANGSDRRLTTYDGPQEFATPGSRANWVAAGSPPISPDTNTPTGQYNTQDGPGGFPPPDDLSNLPTDPAALTRLIDTGQTGIPGFEFNPSTYQPTPGSTFATAAGILATPALGSSAAIRSALYQVMASQPGIELLGTTTDHSGRQGIEIAGPLGAAQATGPLANGIDGVRYEVIIDPTDGVVLETKEVISDPSLGSTVFQNESGDTAGEAITWTDYLSSAVVNTTSATSPSSQAPPPATATTTQGQ